MLNFLDPLSIDNLTIFRDDEDPQKFYVLPDVPAVPLDADGLPQFLFLLYLRDASTVADGEDGGAGYLQFRTVLSLPQPRQDALVAALRTQLANDQAAARTPFGHAITGTEPTLASPLWTSGTVDMSTFAVSDTGLVRQATAKSPADLTGDLGASFTATLSSDGAGVFRAAFDAYRVGGHALPLVITYNLTYAGRISAQLHITAKHSVVHQQVWQHAAPWRLLTTGFARYVPLTLTEPFRIDMLPDLRTRYGRVFPMIRPVDFGTAVQETITANTITVEILEASTGDPIADQATRASLLKLATDLLTDSLMPAMTTGSPVPAASDENATSATSSLMQLDESATPGEATFTLDLTDAMSVLRQAAPNAPLQVVISDPATLQACFQEFRLADDFFKNVRVDISTSGVDFSQDGIEKVHVYWRYSQVDEVSPGSPTIDRHGDVELASPIDTETIRFDTARAADSSHKTRYEYRVDVLWRKGGQPTSVPWTWADSQNLSITPPLLGAINVDAVMTAPPGSVDSARVEITYTSAASTVFTGALELTPSAPRATWLQSTGEIFRPDQPVVAPTYTYKIVYRYQNVEIAMPATTSSEQTIEVPTPFVGTVTFTLVPQASAATVASIAGNLTYADPAHGYTVVRPVALTPGAAPSAITIPVLAGGPRTASCTARVQNLDGTFADLPPATLTEGVNFVGSNPTASLTVQLRTDLIDFAADVKTIQLTLRFTHKDGTVTTAEPVFTAAAHDVFTWTVPRSPDDPLTYDVDVVFYGIDRSKDQTLHLTGQSSTNVELDRSMHTG